MAAGPRQVAPQAERILAEMRAEEKCLEFFAAALYEKIFTRHDPLPARRGGRAIRLASKRNGNGYRRLTPPQKPSRRLHLSNQRNRRILGLPTPFAGMLLTA